MPELPEVEIIKRRLEEILPNKVIDQVTVLRKKSFQGNISQVLNKKFLKISRRAKLLRIHLSDNLNLLIHLKMTGQLIYQDDEIRLGGGHPTADWVNTLPSSHTRIIFKFSDGSHLFFNDMRVFGWIRVLTDSQVEIEFAKLGPDANDRLFTAEYLKNWIHSRRIPIKQAIMLNEVVTGIGNIYAAEALFQAGIDPRRPANSLNMNELKKLVINIKKVLDEGIKHKGTTFDGKYVDLSGMSGEHQHYLKVYGRTGEECVSCGSKLSSVKIAGRGTVFCEKCQN